MNAGENVEMQKTIQKQITRLGIRKTNRDAVRSRFLLGRRQFARGIGVAIAAALTVRPISAFETREKPKERSMEIKRNGQQASVAGPSDWFTGKTRIDPLFDPQGARRAGGACVTFEPGARTAWHTHPLGQTLIVTSGVGRVQVWGEAIQEIGPGDVVWFPPGEKHWHGASPNNAMTHIAIQEAQDGKVVEWLEHVTDDQYEG
ncbi:cupin domain-containing protein [Stieleria sp. JC731]|uniref:(R)-mandelonitrile lyase n=1 Tax=Pirellulaceae TaxID=2691357 RepID=UPI001E3319FD|nr:cupin domain-containing protein [Stieleria sp. JC731]MCC9601925.1 cupin domain-containing protein [Stieleria sp. JC731]